jgi:hypothetical protein
MAPTSPLEARFLSPRVNKIEKIVVANPTIRPINKNAKNPSKVVDVVSRIILPSLIRRLNFYSFKHQN